MDPAQVADLKKLYEDCFGKTLERVNQVYSLNLTAY
jgi:hypothetical protein